MKENQRRINECFRKALLFNSRSEFARHAKAEYAYLWRRGLLDQACQHTQISPVYSKVRWCRESVFKEAEKYKCRAEFKRSSDGAYSYALRRGFLDHITVQLGWDSKYWHVFELMAVALKYNDWKSFRESEPSAYNFASKNGLIPIASAHMRRTSISWTKDMVLYEAKNFSSRGSFFEAFPGAYKHADKNGYWAEACSHMEIGETGFSESKKAILYHLRITLPNGCELFKIGITNRAVKDRISGMLLHKGVSAQILKETIFDSGRDARIAEKRLHRKLKMYRYDGPPVMKNGNTELFTTTGFEF